MMQSSPPTTSPPAAPGLAGAARIARAGRLPAGFDPRAAFATGVPTGLLPLAPERLTAMALQQRFSHPPSWQPERVREPLWLDRPPVAAAVLVPLVQREQLQVLLTERSAQLTHHSGQVAFPGGRTDPGDVDAVATALRESHEEVGLEPAQARVLGMLPNYTTGTGYVVTPVVALVAPDVRLRPNPDEVAAVFEVPLAYLMNPEHHRQHRLEWQEQGRHQVREWLSMPYVDPASGDERFIWGATAAMLRNFYRFLAA